MKRLPLLLSLEHSPDVIETLKNECNLNTYQVKRAKKLLRRGHPPLVRKDILPFMLGISNGLIESMEKFQDRNYRIYRVKKASGGYRTIEAPRSYLKMIQRWIYENILSNIKLPGYITGFVIGKNIFDNAAFHLESKNLMVIDIEDFFPSVSERSVFEIFRKLDYPVKVANRLAKICTLKRRLPQGAPTSPMLANMAFMPIDNKLMELAEAWECVYSRYADDIAFSGQTVFSSKDIAEITKIIRDGGFRVNRRKTRIIGSGGRQILAGLVVNKIGKPARSRRMFWRSMFYHAEKYPEEFINKIEELKGVAAYINEYDNSLSNKYFEIIKGLEAKKQGDRVR